MIEENERRKRLEIKEETVQLKAQLKATVTIEKFTSEERIEMRREITKRLNMSGKFDLERLKVESAKELEMAKQRADNESWCTFLKNNKM